MGLTVAVTGPTGEIGISAVSALERRSEVERIIGMARRPFDPAAHGWHKTEYRQGDILDRSAVDALVADAHVVVHLAYVIMGSREQSREVNLTGTRNVFEATAAGPARRLVYTSSVAAYGYYRENPVPLTEDVPPRGSAEHYYSAQKAECESLLREITAGTDLEVYVLRPCIVAGPTATALADVMPWRQLADKLPSPIRGMFTAVQGVLPLLPDPGLTLQLVHHDDVADAIALAATGQGQPGCYNIAGDGVVTLPEVARATGTRAIRIPAAAATAASAVIARLPMRPSAAEWLHVARTPMHMDTTRAKSGLNWQPRHTAAQTLAEMAAAL